MTDTNLINKLKNAQEEFKRYHILMEYANDSLSAEDSAKAMGIEISTFRTYLSDIQKTGHIPGDKKGPKERYKADKHTERIIELRRKNFDSKEIAIILNRTGNADISTRTVTRVLKEQGSKKLGRRSEKEMTAAKILMEKEINAYSNRCRSDIKDHAGKITSEDAGVFLFVPIIEELKLQEIAKNVYSTRDISAMSYFLTYLGLKLIGAKRYSRIEDYEHDKGLALFAGLNKLPSQAELHTYHYSLTKEYNKNMRIAYGKAIREHIGGNYFNLDFKSILFFGDSDELQKNYTASAAKARKSSLAFLVQDQESTMFCYSDGDVKKESKDDMALEFVSYWEDVTGKKPEFLIFDSKVTTYLNLWKLDKEGVKFLTLRRRGKDMVAIVEKIPKEDWKTVRMKNEKRKYRNLRVADDGTRKTTLDAKDKDSKVKLNVRQLIITNNGRDEPTFMVTNDEELSTKDIVELYPPRGRIENGISDEVGFFNLNALPSTLGVKRDFDVLMTQIASSLYKLLAKDIRSFEKTEADRLYDKFIKGGRSVEVFDDKIVVELIKKKYTPLLRDAEFMKKEIRASWLENKKIEFRFV